MEVYRHGGLVCGHEARSLSQPLTQFPGMTPYNKTLHFLLLKNTSVPPLSSPLYPRDLAGAANGLTHKYLAGYWLLAIAICYWLLAIGYWLLAIGYWLLTICYWLLAIGESYNYMGTRNSMFHLTGAKCVLNCTAWRLI